jgi:hypothetical protein
VSNRFHEGMPAYLLSSNRIKRDTEEEEPDEGNHGKKRLKSGKDNKEKFKDFGEMVKNRQANQDWILPGAKYKSIITREVIGSTPPLNDTGLITCNKWHIRGFCFEKCDRKGSHKKLDSVTHKNAYDAWFKALKSKNP